MKIYRKINLIEEEGFLNTESCFFDKSGIPDDSEAAGRQIAMIISGTKRLKSKGLIIYMPSSVPDGIMAEVVSQCALHKLELSLISPTGKTTDVIIRSDINTLEKNTLGEKYEDMTEEAKNAALDFLFLSLLKKI